MHGLQLTEKSAAGPTRRFLEPGRGSVGAFIMAISTLFALPTPCFRVPSFCRQKILIRHKVRNRREESRYKGLGTSSNQDPTSYTRVFPSQSLNPDIPRVKFKPTILRSPPRVSQAPKCMEAPKTLTARQNFLACNTVRYVL